MAFGVFVTLSKERISEILGNLHPFISLVEQKTGKRRVFTVPLVIGHFSEHLPALNFGKN